jgi:hypothetical protein
LRIELSDHAWVGAGREGVRIDWIMHSRRHKYLEATIDCKNAADDISTDHCLVTAVSRPARITFRGIKPQALAA